jgi:hypothetical protein
LFCEILSKDISVSISIKGSRGIFRRREYPDTRRILSYWSADK